MVPWLATRSPPANSHGTLRGGGGPGLGGVLVWTIFLLKGPDAERQTPMFIGRRVGKKVQKPHERAQAIQKKRGHVLQAITPKVTRNCLFQT